MTGITNVAVLERVIDLPGPDFPGGSQYAYCNTGYVPLALIVAIVSGQSFAELLKANFFDPLGMKHTLVYDTSRPVVHKLAQRYFRENGQFHRWDYPLLTAGDGGLFSALDDLFSGTGFEYQTACPKSGAGAGLYLRHNRRRHTSWLWLRLNHKRLSLLERCRARPAVLARRRWSAARCRWGRPLPLQLHHLFSRYPAHDHRPDQSPGVPSPRIRAHQVAGILFSDRAENCSSNPKPEQ